MTISGGEKRLQSLTKFRLVIHSKRILVLTIVLMSDSFKEGISFNNVSISDSFKEDISFNNVLINDSFREDINFNNVLISELFREDIVSRSFG